MSADDLVDYTYLHHRDRPTGVAGMTDYERWWWYATNNRSTLEGAVEQWRVEQSLPWLYVTLARASSALDDVMLIELLKAAEAVSQDTPGHFNLLMQRIRILGLLRRTDDGLRLAEEAIGKSLDRSRINRIRIATANSTSNWTDYFQWASLKPLSLPWTDDFARRMPSNFNPITTDTSLFGKDTTDLLNGYFTASMIEEVIDTPGLSDYQRGRLAIAGWTKAMLADDLVSASKLAALIRRHVPWLDRDLALFEQAKDKHFEAARIIFDYPAFSPWMESGAGRVYTGWGGDRQIPDHVTKGQNWPSWWCSTRWGNYEIDEEMLQNPRFSHYSESELAEIRKVVEYRETSVTAAFGPHVIRYARDHLDDPNVPRTLHRLVFATRHACYWSVPGKISQAAYALLHENFPNTEWAAKTPYWYGTLD